MSMVGGWEGAEREREREVRENSKQVAPAVNTKSGVGFKLTNHEILT